MEVWLHVGTGKTGTSAIQVALARGRDRLARAGIAYPVSLYRDQDQAAIAGATTSGNAVAVGRLINPRLRVPQFDLPAAMAWLERVLEDTGDRTLLLSSETMQMPHAGAVEPVLELLRRGGRRVRVLYYLRHALDFAVAGYAQVLKIGRADAQAGSLDDHLARMTVPFRSQLAAWAGFVGQDSVTCRLYDEDRPALLPRLLGTVRAEAADALAEIESEAPPGVVNRSPTPTEMRLLRRLNAEPDAERLCRHFVNAVLNAPPAEAETLAVGAEAFAAFTARNQPVLDRVNAEWLAPAGRGPVLISAGRIRTSDPAPTEAPPGEATLAACWIRTVRMLDEAARAAAPPPPPAALPPPPAPLPGPLAAAFPPGPGAGAVRAVLQEARGHAQAGRVAEALAVLDAAPATVRDHERAQLLRGQLERRLGRPAAPPG